MHRAVIHSHVGHSGQRDEVSVPSQQGFEKVLEDPPRILSRFDDKQTSIPLPGGYGDKGGVGFMLDCDDAWAE